MIKSRVYLYKLFKKLKITTGAELGVAAGWYSKHLVTSHMFQKFYCIDKWNDHHDEKERLFVQNTLGILPQVTILHESFESAVSKFEDNYFDFIYIDGYAHTGQDEGKTLIEWWPKLRTGGIFAGHDYCPVRWPKTYHQVNQFLQKKLGYKIHTTKELTDPSWYVLK